MSGFCWVRQHEMRDRTGTDGESRKKYGNYISLCFPRLINFIIDYFICSSCTLSHTLSPAPTLVQAQAHIFVHSWWRADSWAQIPYTRSQKIMPLVKFDMWAFFSLSVQLSYIEHYATYTWADALYVYHPKRN